MVAEKVLKSILDNIFSNHFEIFFSNDRIMKKYLILNVLVKLENN